MSIHISEDTLKNIISESLKKDTSNKNLFIDGLIKCIDTTSLSYLVHILTAKEKQELIYRNDYVKVHVNEIKSDIGKVCDLDALTELGLIENNEYVFAKVKASSSWSSDYNAYNGRLILDFLYHDEEKELKFSERSVNTSDLIKIKKEDIPYYKNQENGTSIKTIITERDQGMEDNQKNVF
jgi:hypothetical protein